MSGHLFTYQEIAARWQTHVRTVRRWVCALERQKLLSPLRPTRTTMRLTQEQVDTLESEVIRFKCK